MACRYHSLQPIEGCNFYAYYQSAAGTTGLGGDVYTRLGVKLGTRVSGTLNTTWLYCGQTNAAAISANTPTLLNATNFLVDAGGTITGRTVINLPAAAGIIGCGLWFEISGANLDTTTP